MKTPWVDDDAELSEEEFRLLRDFIHERFGLYFDGTQRSSLRSRLAPRLDLLGLLSFEDYYRYLRFAPERKAEQQRMVSHLTNNETYFFRETDQFKDLFGETLQALKATAMVPGRLRFLCAGCSSGEEPHTLSIFRREHRAALGDTKLEIEGFDIDPDRLQMAREAVYGPNSLRALDATQLERYFEDRDGGNHLLKDLFRDGVRFSPGNILERSTYQKPSPYDVVFCRNVLIYFSEAALHRAIDNFAGVLRPGGLLFLGHSESIIGLSRFFETVRLERCIAYKRVIP